MNNFFSKNIVLLLAVTSSVALLGAEYNNDKKAIVRFSADNDYHKISHLTQSTFQKDALDYKTSLKQNKEQIDNSEFNRINKEQKTALLLSFLSLPEEQRKLLENKITNHGYSKEEFYKALKIDALCFNDNKKYIETYKDSRNQLINTADMTIIQLPTAPRTHSTMTNDTETRDASCLDTMCTLF